MWNLTIEKVNEIFKQKNPTGEIRRTDKGFRVIFQTAGKVYNYRVKKLFSLCEKLDMVPETNVRAIADEIAGKLQNGETEVVALAIPLDTLRWLTYDICPAGQSLMVEEIGMDEWNRVVGKFSFQDDPWLS